MNLVVESTMKRAEIEALKEKIRCGAVLESAGFDIDTKESTPRAIKYRRGGEIIIVTHAGRGWFDPLSEGKGDIFLLLAHLERVDFNQACERLVSFSGQSLMPANVLNPSSAAIEEDLATRWDARCRPWRGSATWCYLTAERMLPYSILQVANNDDSLREGPNGSMWAAHRHEDGQISGWEIRGPAWRGFAKGGAKALFRLGKSDGLRVCVTEAAIDAMSLAAIEGLRDDTLYLSTGGGWSQACGATLRALASRAGSQMVAATDANSQGEAYAQRLRALADDGGCDWTRLRPPEEDWNEALKVRENQRRAKSGKVRAACALPLSIEASPGRARS